MVDKSKFLQSQENLISENNLDEYPRVKIESRTEQNCRWISKKNHFDYDLLCIESARRNIEAISRFNTQILLGNDDMAASFRKSIVANLTIMNQIKDIK